MKTKLRLLLFVLFALQVNAQSTAPGTGVNTIVNITNTTATVNYAVRTNGSNTSCQIWVLVDSNMNPLLYSTGNVSFSQNGAWQNASVNLNGLTAGTTYYLRSQATNSLGTVSSSIKSFTTLSTNTGISYSNLTATAITVNSATVTAGVINGCNSTSVVNMEYSLSNIFSTLAGAQQSININNFTTQTKSFNISGLTANTLYYYRFFSNANQSCSNALVMSNVQSFTTAGAIAEYDFNGTLNNINGTTPFNNVFSNVFVEDRNGNPNQALNLVNGSSGASISNLPIGNDARSVSIWVRPTLYS